MLHRAALAALVVATVSAGRLRAAQYSEDDAKIAAILSGMAYIDRPGWCAASPLASRMETKAVLGSTLARGLFSHFRVFGFVAHDLQTKDVYVAFRSQHDVQDVTSDKFRLRLKDWSLSQGAPPGVKVADRLQEMLRSVLVEFEDALRASAAFAAQHGSRILFTGHSSGGSLATLAAFYAHQTGLLGAAAARAVVVSFGSPRVGNTPFSVAYRAALPNTWRVVRRADPFVHRLGCKWALFRHRCKESSSHGYHVPTEVYYEEDMPDALHNGGLSAGQDSGMYRVCTGDPRGEDSSCSTKHVFKLDSDLHQSAFGVNFQHLCDGWRQFAEDDLGYDEGLARYLAVVSNVAYAVDPAQCDYVAPIARGEWRILHQFRQPYLRHELFGFILEDTVKQRIVVAWRGTNKGKQLWDQILRGGTVPFPHDSSVQLVKFYRGAIDAVDELVLRRLQSAMRDRPGWAVMFTGHSLGGAMASLTAYAAAKAGVVHPREQPVEVYTFGQPRVGDAAFAYDFSRFFPRAIRVAFRADPIPHWPFCAMGWNRRYDRSWHCREARGKPFHFPTLVYYPDQMPDMIDGNGEVAVAPSAPTYRLCLGEPFGEDPNCHKAAGFPLRIAVSNHNGMFNTPHMTKMCKRSSSGVDTVDEEAPEELEREFDPSSAAMRDIASQIGAFERDSQDDERAMVEEEREVEEEMDREAQEENNANNGATKSAAGGQPMHATRV